MSLKIEGQSYIFKFEYTNILTEDSDTGSCSENVKNKYTKWAQINGKQVVVVKTDDIGSYLVYIKQDGPDFCFRSSGCYLFDCTCDLTLLMNRGCQCGFFSMEQKC